MVGVHVRGSALRSNDSEVDLRFRQRGGVRRAPWAVLGVISAGGVVGAECRVGVSVLWPQSAGGFPWATFLINVSGCFLIGVLVVLIAEVWSAHRLLRPFLGVGVLGGYTTFSTYVLDVQQLVTAGAARTALLYLMGTPLVAVAAAYGGMFITRLGGAGKSRRREQR